MNSHEGPRNCCIDLKLASNIIGCLEIVHNFMIILASVFGMFMMGKYYGYSLDPYVYGLFVVMTILGCFGLVVSSFFLYGIYKKDSMLLRPWLAYAFIDITVTLISLIISSIKVNQVHTSLKGLMLFFLIFACFWLVCKGSFTPIVYNNYKLLVSAKLHMQIQPVQNFQIAYEHNHQSGKSAIPEIYPKKY